MEKSGIMQDTGLLFKNVFFSQYIIRELMSFASCTASFSLASSDGHKQTTSNHNRTRQRSTGHHRGSRVPRATAVGAIRPIAPIFAITAGRAAAIASVVAITAGGAAASRPTTRRTA